MSNRKTLLPREELTVIEDRLLEEAQRQFWAEMDRVLAQLKAVLDKHRIPIVAKMDIEDWKKTKEAFAKLLFMVIDRADDDDDAEHHKTVKLEKDWSLTREFPSAFYELMRIAAVGEFLKQYSLNAKAHASKKELKLPKINFGTYPYAEPKLACQSRPRNKMSAADKIKNNIVD